MATNAGKSPQRKGSYSNNSRPYAPADREAFKTPVQPSAMGLDKIKSNCQPEQGTNEIA